VTLPARWETDALTLVEQASPVEGQVFRSVELAHGYPDDVISVKEHGCMAVDSLGRDREPSTGSFSEETARESAARISRLAGRGRRSRLVAYPRITYVIRVTLATHVDLTVAPVSRAFLTPCIDPNDLTAQRNEDVGPDS
jgi:hypothetical protein